MSNAPKTSVLKGNFETRGTVEVTREAPSLEDQFEREALKRLGGSIAFVSRKKFLWTGDNQGDDPKDRSDT
jgi:hypothetical protein